MQTNQQPAAQGAGSSLIERLDALYEYDREPVSNPWIYL